ncbi:MAG: hypothetical protein ACFFCI_01075 [Promethearchaeota archaeon]
MYWFTINIFLFWLSVYFFISFFHRYYIPKFLLSGLLLVFSLLLVGYYDVNAEFNEFIAYWCWEDKDLINSLLYFFLLFFLTTGGGFLIQIMNDQDKKYSRGRAIDRAISDSESSSSKEDISIETFKINDLIELKLIGKETVIYINGERFNQCKYLLLNLENGNRYKEIRSIDEAAEALNGDMERKHSIIDPQEEFWGHCSNLQAWYDNNYDTRLLRQNLAFPLLLQLVHAGDDKAKIRLKEELILRMDEGYENTIRYILENEYLEDHFTKEELLNAIEGMENKEIAYGLKFYIKYVMKTF